MCILKAKNKKMGKAGHICARENGRYSKISDFEGCNQMSDWMSDQMLDRMMDRMLDGLQCNAHCNLIQYWIS